MKKKSLLSYEDKIILSIIFIALLIFLPINIMDNLTLIKEKIVEFYDKNINIYPLWAQLAVVITPFLIYFIVVQIRKNRCSYKEDEIYNMVWKWEWSKDEIVNLQCFCPTCNEKLYYDTTKTNYNYLAVSKLDFICKNCNKIVGSIPNTNKITRPSANIKKEIKRVINKRLSKKLAQK